MKARRSLVAACGLARGLACTTTTPGPAIEEVPRAYRLYADDDCDALHARAESMDWSVDDSLEPLFDLLRGYCFELEGRIEDAQARYTQVVVDAPATQQAYEASLRLGTLAQLARPGPSRAQQVARQLTTRTYRHGSKPVVQAEPTYSSALRDAGIEGFAVVDFAIAPNGRTEDAFVVGSKPPFVLDADALRTVREWIYEPHSGKRPRRDRVKLDFDPTSAGAATP